ncbi:hypothetical protein SAY87_015828 [Trapa incisa]|uniref:Uncharacterized protein n=1 Tax=Trapa incisa TaxID=236973 RepID=A0AAN7LG13_9MYRT|nr:hypothetical protein SAY87_015828 [Trapa incisa]
MEVIHDEKNKYKEMQCLGSQLNKDQSMLQDQEEPSCVNILHRNINQWINLQIYNLNGKVHSELTASIDEISSRNEPKRVERRISRAMSYPPRCIYTYAGLLLHVLQYTPFSTLQKNRCTRSGGSLLQSVNTVKNIKKMDD